MPSPAKMLKLDRKRPGLQRCPKCKILGNTRRTDARPIMDGLGMRRRVACVTCGHRWTTIEIEHARFIAMRQRGRMSTKLRATINDLLTHLGPSESVHSDGDDDGDLA